MDRLVRLLHLSRTATITSLLLCACQPITGANGQPAGYGSGSSQPAPVTSEQSLPPVLPPRQIDALVKRDCPNVSGTILATGRVNGLSTPITLVNVAGDGCSGGSATPNDLIGIYRQAGRTKTVYAPTEFLILERATFSGGAVLAQGLALGPNDPRCCPTVRRTMRMIFASGKFVEVR